MLPDRYAPNLSPGALLSCPMERKLNWRSLSLKQLLIGVAACATYILAAKLSLRLATVHPSASPFWPPTGIAIVTLLLLGLRYWPAIFVGAFFANLTTAGSVLTSLGIGVGNCLEAVTAAYLVSRFASGKDVFESTWGILRFALYGGILSTGIAATLGVTSLALGGFAPWHEYGIIWRTWWLGDAAGALVFAPFLLLWSANPVPRWTKRQYAEAAALLASTLLVSGIVFGPVFHLGIKNDPWTFLCTPFLIWVAFRFGTREASAIICIVCAIAVVGTTHGYGPFARLSPNDSLMLLQSFLSIQALMTLVFAAEVSERRRQEEHAKQLAVRDPLTGLANYRLLVDRVDEQIKRYGRTKKPFVVLLMDLDRLKKINDEYGHLVGSMAICRLAEVLHLSCRETDTAARYGGDEFALVLTETSAESAALVAQRVAHRLSLDAEEPRLSVSIGIAEFPRDGATIEHLLSAADQSLYNDKRRDQATLPHMEK
ncbi:MAG TPA: MASE1 domain-containing protein [Candidatus Acidoferrum sp.]|nr:MASE1 domain-containing protein [Candidatus Acidoferrum sp.]